MTPTTNKFKSLLGAETADGWIVFMDAVKAELPFLFDSGRPSKQQIAESEIGRTGHTSWADYVEKELAWNTSQWRAWMRAYKVILDNEYLRDLDLSSSAINTMSRKVDEFPDSAEAWNKQREAVQSDQDDRQANSLADAKRINAELRSELDRLTGELDTAVAENESLHNKMKAFNLMKWYQKIWFQFV